MNDCLSLNANTLKSLLWSLKSLDIFIPKGKHVLKTFTTLHTNCHSSQLSIFSFSYIFLSKESLKMAHPSFILPLHALSSYSFFLSSAKLRNYGKWSYGRGGTVLKCMQMRYKKRAKSKEKQVSYVSNGRSLLQKTQNVEKIRCFTFTLSFFSPSSFFYISIVVVRYLKNLFLTSIMFCYYKVRYSRNEGFKVKVCFLVRIFLLGII